MFIYISQHTAGNNAEVALIIVVVCAAGFQARDTHSAGVCFKVDFNILPAQIREADSVDSVNIPNLTLYRHAFKILGLYLADSIAHETISQENQPILAYTFFIVPQPVYQVRSRCARLYTSVQL